MINEILKLYHSICEGLTYLLSYQNRSLFIILFIKSSAAISWGLAELLEVEYSSMSNMHQLGNESSTLGYIYASTGIGCILGPILISFLILNNDYKTYWFVIVISFFLCLISSFLLIIASNIYYILISSFLRACSSSIVWIYSTLLLQILNDKPEYFGRIFSTEICFFTFSKCVGLFLGSTVLDRASFSIKQTSFIMFILSMSTWFVWSIYYWFHVVPTIPTESEESNRTSTTKNSENNQTISQEEPCKENIEADTTEKSFLLPK